MNAFDPTHVLSQTAAEWLAADPAQPILVPAKPLTEAGLCDWIASSAAGERIQYHQGLLLRDRSDVGSPYTARERQRIQAVAKRAWVACELGLIHLVSQRVEPFVFNYIAVRSLMTAKAAQVRKQQRADVH